MRPMRAFVVAACAILVVSCAGRPASVGGDKPGRAVARIPVPRPSPPAARPRPPWPWSAIGRVNRQGGGFCSGTLIGPDKVLMTAHCLWDARLRRWTSAADLHFLAGYHLGNYLAHGKAKAIELPAGIEMTAQGIPRRAANDWAILTLTRPIGTESAVRPIEVARFKGRLRPNALGPLLRAGYGPLRPHAIESARCRAVSLINPVVLLHDCCATSAESGFPILLETPEGWRMLGLQMISPNQAVGCRGLGMALLVTALERPRQMLLW